MASRNVCELYACGHAYLRKLVDGADTIGLTNTSGTAELVELKKLDGAYVRYSDVACDFEACQRDSSLASSSSSNSLPAVPSLESSSGYLPYAETSSEVAILGVPQKEQKQDDWYPTAENRGRRPFSFEDEDDADKYDSWLSRPISEDKNENWRLWLE